MKRFCDWCLNFKIAVVEIASLVGLVVALGFMIYLEWHHFVQLAR